MNRFGTASPRLGPLLASAMPLHYGEMSIWPPTAQISRGCLLRGWQYVHLCKARQNNP